MKGAECIYLVCCRENCSDAVTSAKKGQHSQKRYCAVGKVASASRYKGKTSLVAWKLPITKAPLQLIILAPDD